METDIDRLHDVVTGQVSGRGCGKTVAACHAVSGFIETSAAELIGVLVSCSHDIEHVEKTLWKVFDEHGIRIACRRSHHGLAVDWPRKCYVRWLNMADSDLFFMNPYGPDALYVDATRSGTGDQIFLVYPDELDYIRWRDQNYERRPPMT